MPGHHDAPTGARLRVLTARLGQLDHLPAPGLGDDVERCAPVRGAARARREADETCSTPALDACAYVRQVAREPQRLRLEGDAEQVERMPAVFRISPPRPAGRGTRASAANARGFASGSPSRRSIASAPIRPTPSPVRLLPRPAVRVTRSTPVTVCNSRSPRAASAGRARGSSRAPTRDFVFLIPFAIAPIRPRSRVSRWRIRSASAIGSSAGRSPRSCRCAHTFNSTPLPVHLARRAYHVPLPATRIFSIGVPSRCTARRRGRRR